MSAAPRRVVRSLLLVLLALPAFGASSASANALTRAETIEDARLTTASLGGIRDFGDGSLTMVGVQGKVRKALLFWHGPTNTTDPLVNADVTFAGAPITGQNIGFSSDNFWGYQNSQAYRADVTALVAGDGVYTLANFTKGATNAAGSANVNGVSLVVFSEPDAPGQGRDFVIAQGNDSNYSSAYDGARTTFTIPNVQYSYLGGTAGLGFHVSDGQSYQDEGLNVNGTQFLADGPNYQGTSVPLRPGGSAGSTNGGLWDFRRIDGLESKLVPGTNTLTVQTRQPVSDALAYILAIVDLPVYSFAPSLSVANVSAAEDNADGRARFTVTLSEAVDTDTTFDYTTADGTATSPDDYTPTSGTGTIPAGQTTTTIDVPISNDVPDEADETFTLTLSNAGPQGTQITVPTATATIVDPPPTITFGTPPSVTEESPDDLVFTLQLSQPSTRELTVNVSTEDLTASAPGDYAAASNAAVVFPAGTTEQTFTVAVRDDTTVERAETMRLGAAIGTAAPVRQTGTINSGDTAAITAADLIVDEAVGNATLTFTADNPISGAYTFKVRATEDGSADSGSDFAGGDTYTANFGGTKTATVAIPVTNDTADEDDETFTVELFDVEAPFSGDTSATVMITDNDLAPTVSFGTAPAVSEESPDDLVFTLRLSEASERDLSVAVVTEDGTAVTPGDYVAANGAVLFPAGTTEQTFAVAVTNDTLLESDETLQLAASVDSGTPVRQTGTITSTDKAVLSAADVTVAEAGGSAVVTFKADQAIAAAFDFTVRTADGSATSGEDYTGGDTYSANFGGTDTATVSIPITNDTVNETDETFTVEGVNTAAAFSGDTDSIVTIADDEAVDASVSDGIGNEGGSLDFTVTLDAPSARATSVRLTTSSGSAVSGSDFAGVNQLVLFAAGETSKTVTVLLTTDTVHEDDETFTATLSEPSTGAVIDDGTGTGTIRANGAPTVSVSSPDATEGDPLDFVIALSAPAQRALTVDFATDDDTATSPADFEAQTGSVSFAVGEQEKTVSIVVAEDTRVEADETLELDVTVPGEPTPITGTGTISDDDGAAVSVDAPSVEEGDAGTAPATVTVRLAEPADRDVAYRYSTEDGTAKDGTDYEDVSGIGSIEAGDTTGTFEIPVIGDTTYETRRETVSITVEAPVRVTRQNGRAAPDVFVNGTLTILDEDPLSAPVIETGPPATTTASSAEFTLSGLQAGAAYECSLDAAAFTACPDPLRYTGLANGDHVFSVRQVADAGRTSPVATRSFRVAVPAPAPVKPAPVADPCESAPGIRSVGAIARSGGRVRFELTRRVDLPVQVDVFSVSKGSRVIKERLVARFENRRAAFLWNGRTLDGKRAPSGTYLVRYRMWNSAGHVDTQRIVLSKTAGVFSRRGDSHRRDQCLLLTRFKLERPVFGGISGVPLRIAYVLSKPGSVTVDVLRGSTVVKRFDAVQRAAGQTFRIELSPRGLANGTYRVRVRATRPGATTEVASLYSKNL